MVFVTSFRIAFESKKAEIILLNETKVAAVSRLKQWFGDGTEGYIRMSFVSSEEFLTDTLGRAKKYLK
jgi:bifunctional pyridoxal-dependent enzyme with beta-cystathionase and maltose regulon repressor activities